MKQDNPAVRQAKPKMYFFRDYRHLARLFYSGAVFVAFDTETTGLRSSSDYLIEVGAVKFTCRGEISRFDMLIKPPVMIQPFFTELTHITNEMVESCPPESCVLPEFLRFVGSRDPVLIAHNAPFDLGFIDAGLARMSIPPVANMCIDTLPLARWAYPGFAEEEVKGQYRLQSLAGRFGVQVLAAHRADDDARVLMEVFKRIVSDTLPRQKGFDALTGCIRPEVQDMQLELF